MTPLWKLEERLDWEDPQRTTWLEWLVLGVGLGGMVIVTVVAVWLW